MRLKVRPGRSCVCCPQVQAMLTAVLQVEGWLPFSEAAWATHLRTMEQVALLVLALMALLPGWTRPG